MPDYAEEIRELEEELRKTPYNKSTQHHVGLIKAKIARLRERQETRQQAKGKTAGYSVRKSGDATAVLVGFPSVGKSTVLNKITNAESKAAEYAFTTLGCIPGLLEHRHAKIQVLDVPGLISGAAKGQGKGREVLSVVRTADAIIFVVDVRDLKQYAALRKELRDANIRVDEQPPNIRLRKTARGGVKIDTTVTLTQLDEHTIAAVLQEFKYSNAHLVIREDISVDQLIDVIEGNRLYLPSLLLLNKADLATQQQIAAAAKQLPESLIISAAADDLENVKDALFEKLGFMRIFLKEAGKKTDAEPLIMRQGSSVENVCTKVHRDFLRKFRFAKVWGKSAKFPGQRFKEKHVLADGDTVQLFLR